MIFDSFFAALFGPPGRKATHSTLQLQTIVDRNKAALSRLQDTTAAIRRTSDFVNSVEAKKKNVKRA